MKRRQNQKQQRKEKKLDKKEEEKEDDEEITSETSEDEPIKPKKQKKVMEVEDEEEEPKETHDEMRARVARAYLEKLDAIHRVEDESSEEYNEKIGSHLQQEAQTTKKAVTTFRPVADQVASFEINSESIKFKKAHQLPVTCITVSTDGLHIFSGSKDCCVVQLEIPTLKIIQVFKGHRKEITRGHRGHVSAVAVSSDKTFLASGGEDQAIKIYNLTNNTLAKTFTGHKDTVTALTFRHASTDLYSGSKDRTVKIWDVSTLAYIDTLFGHELSITGIDSQYQERCITSSEDSTSRLWKITEESQLVFRAERKTVDCISYISEDKWVTGSQQGTINLWSIIKKKPIFEVKDAHGMEGITPNWISAVASLKYTDLIATGSCDGNIKLWKITKENNIIHIKDIPLIGWINALHFTSNGKYLVAGVGQEPKYGRWSPIKKAKNGIFLIPLQ